MSDSKKAVFLSYASQDAEAAKCICDSLRAAGVEVWFDTEGGLEHGDEWDAKIRRQIKECVLFLPIISANTQARHEGYFRIEWELAAQRAMGFASGVAYILPVVIDATREPDALVPDRFRSVQWTRVAGGVVPPDVQARFLKLWSTRTGALNGQASHGVSNGDLRPPEAAPAIRPHRSPAMRYALASVGVLVAGAAAFFLVKPRGGADDPVKMAAVATAPEASSTAKNPVPRSEAQALTAKAWEQMNKAELARAELEVADGLCKRATELDPNDADAWAAWSQVDAWYIFHQLSNTRERQDGARTKAAHALQLAPNGFEARLAQACYLVRGRGDVAVSTFAPEAERLLRGLLIEKPDEPRALLALGILERNLGHPDEARSALGRLAQQPAFAAIGWSELGWAEFIVGSRAAAEAAVDRSLTIQPYWGNRALKVFLLQYWYGDVGEAEKLWNQNPVAIMEEDFGLAVSLELAFWRRDAPRFLRLSLSVPRDWMQSNEFDGPTGWWTGHAEQLAGHAEAARVQWTAALKLVERRLAETPSSAALMGWKGELLAVLGEPAESDQALRLAQEMGASGRWLNFGYVRALNGHGDAEFEALEQRCAANPGVPGVGSAATVRLSPWLDPLRTHPRFAALQARLDADPRSNPEANKNVVDEKSVAVLPFANMSAEKDSAFFSDGIHEDILTNLSNIRSLHVVSRTSVMRYRDTTKPLPQIAKELGVAYILEGSVRRAGNKVRVTGQLIRAATDDHVWAKAYDRDLSDIFAIQSELAQAIATELKAAISPEEIAELARRPTENLEAYNLVLVARGIMNRQGANSQAEGLQQVIQLLQRAVEIDPGFARAWALMAVAHAVMIDLSSDQSAARERMAWAALEQAAKFAPDSREVHQARGTIFYALQDYARAYEENEWVLTRYPQEADSVRAKGFIQRRWGRWADALLTLRRALELDPTNIVSAQNVALHCFDMRRYDEARVAYQRLAELRPEELDNWRLPAGFATLDFLARGSTVEGDAFFAALSATERDGKAMIVRRKDWALAKGDLASFSALETATPDPEHYGFALAEAMLIRGADPAAVNAKLTGMIEKLRTDVPREPANENKWMALARVEALAGEREAAVRDGLKATELLPISRDAFFGGRLRYQLGVVYAWAGDHDRAIEELTARLRTPPAVSTYFVRNSPDWWPLRDDPRFKALVDDPKNNAPLF